MKQPDPAPLRLSVIVPCYNEASGIAALCERTLAVCQKTVGDSFELLLINDGSTDATGALIHEKAQTVPQIVAVTLSRNYGHQMALTAGLSLCRGQCALIMDADLQDPPELLPAMMEKMESEKADIVYGQRLRREGEGWFKRASACLFYRLMGRWAEAPLPLDTGDFRLINRRVIDLLNSMPEQHRYLRGLMGWIGGVQIPFPYERAPRLNGTTKYPLRKMLRFALDALTGFSIMPLRIASYLGAGFGLVGLALLLYVFRAWIAGETVAGWTSLMVVVLVIGSVQLLCLGVFGEYLGRLYMESKRRPLFVIESVVGRDR